MAMPDENVERILVIAAHPDDVDFGVAGTVATWTDLGIAVTYCMVTNGDAGGFDPAIARSEIAGIRQAEQTAAAKEVGVHELVFLGHPDGYLEPTLTLRRDLARVIRQVRPQRVVCQAATRNLDRIFASHPDHLAAGEATMCAVYPDARNEFWCPELVAEGHQPWSVSEVWIMGGQEPNHFVDVTVQVERKLAALRRHESQHRNPDGVIEMVSAWLLVSGTTAGLPEGHSAEAFRVVATR